jgi:hypothetical protein
VSNVFQSLPHSQNHLSSLRGDQPHRGQRIRGGSDLPGFFSFSSSRSGTISGLSVTFCALEGALVKASFSAGLREFLMWSVVALSLTVCFVGFAVVFQMTRVTLKILKAIEVISKA